MSIDSICALGEILFRRTTVRAKMEALHRATAMIQVEVTAVSDRTGLNRGAAHQRLDVF